MDGRRRWAMPWRTPSTPALAGDTRFARFSSSGHTSRYQVERLRRILSLLKNLRRSRSTT
jgi:hypothetical protein